MIPCGFEQSNCVLDKPSDMEECNPLQVWKGETSENKPIVVSCWKLTKEELKTFQQTGRIWLIVCGQTMPPIIMTAEEPWDDH